MGRRGPIRQTEQSAKAKGSFRAHRYANDLPVKASLPDPPSWLTCENALGHWHRIGPLLVEKRLVCQLDADSFGLLCKTLAELEECDALIAEHGLVAYSDKGAPYQHPAVSIRNRLRADFRQWVREFGMTYSSRIGLGSGEKPQEDDPIEAMLSRVMGEG